MTRTAELMRAIRGPVVLITLGALLLADRMSGVSITKTWPVLLIVFGLMKLLERTAAPGAGGEFRHQA
jgi:hypothetical protein